MSEVRRNAYNAFRCDLAKVHKTFSACTQTNFAEETGTLTDQARKSPQLADKCLDPVKDYNG